MTTGEALLLLGLMVVDAFLTMARAALINVRKPRLRQLVEEGLGSARTAERLAENSNRLLATTQLGMMLTTFFAGAVVATTWAPQLAVTLGKWLGTASYSVAFTLVVFGTAVFMLLLAELVPEIIATQHSERLALLLAPPLSIVAIITMPVIRLMEWVTLSISRVFGLQLTSSMPFVTEEEIKTMVDAGEEGGVIPEEEAEMIYSILNLADTLAREVMVPRIDVVAVDVTTPMLEALDVLMEAGHSRIPVYRDTIDNVMGLLYAKDVLPYLRNGQVDVPLIEILREAYFIPETKNASDLLLDLQQRRVHIAIVVDEYGGMAGLVTIEDLLEEIVGEIQDEYDSEEPFIEFVDENEYLLDGRVDLDDLNRLMDIEIPTGESDTLGGFIFSSLGRVPSVGNRVTFDNLDFTVESVAGRRIQKVRVQRHTPPPEEEKDESGHGNGK